MRNHMSAALLVVMGCVIGAAVTRQVSVNAADTKITPQDYMEIQQLYAKYYHSWDSGDAEGYVSVFTPDGTFNQAKGHDALRAIIVDGPAKGTPLRHWQSNLLLAASPEGIRAKVYVIQFDIRARPIAAASYSRYDDLLVKRGGKWLFKEKMRSSDTTFGGGRGTTPGASPPPAAGAVPR